MSKRFVIRNYGQTRSIGGHLLVRDKVIETDDEDLANIMRSQPEVHVTENTGAEPQVTGVPLPPIESEESSEESLENTRDNNVPEPGAVITPPPDEENEVEDEVEYEEENFDNGRIVEVGYEDLKVIELKEILRDRQLSTKGNKKELVERLIKNDEEDSK
jgi:hypothetical protein